MASPGWRTNRALSALVLEQYGRFDVFQLVRLLRWKSGGSGSDSGAPLSAWDVAQRFRFRADLSPAFPGREISRLSAVEPPQGKRFGLQRRVAHAPEVIEIRTPNYCAAGELGPLPEPFTEWVREQEKAREHAMADFLDLFTQRLNVLRFEMKAQQTLGLSNLPPADTPHAMYLASLMGLGQEELAAQVPLPRRAWLGLAGLLSNDRKSASAVTHVLTLFLGARVTLTQLVGAWQGIEKEDHIALGRRNHGLGQQSLLGRRVWDQQARVRLRVGLLDYERFCMLLPPAGETRAASHFDGFLALLRLLLDRLHDCEVQLRVRTASIPASRLTASPDTGADGYRGLRLGQTAWLNGGRQDGVRCVRYLIRAYDDKEAA